MQRSNKVLTLLCVALLNFAYSHAVNLDIQMEYAEVLLALKDYNAAIQIYDELIKDPEIQFDEERHQALVLGRAQALDWADRDAEAIKAYLQVNEQSSEVQKAIAVCYMTLKNWKQAETIYQTLLLESPNDPELHLLVGDCLRMQGELLAAEETYKRLSEHPRALQGLAAIAEASYRPQTALEAYRKVLVLDPRPDSNLAYIRALGLCGRFFEAHKELAQMAEKSDKQQLLRAQLYAWAGCLHRALYELEAIESMPSEVWSERAKIYLRSGQKKRAQEALTFAGPQPAEIFSGSDRYQQIRSLMRDAYTALKAGNPPEGTALIEKACLLLPESTSLQLSLVEAYTSQGRFEEAHALCQQIIKVEPQHEGARLLLAQNRAWSHHFEEAYEAYETLLQIDPLHSRARLELARVLSWNNEYEKSFIQYGQLQQKDLAYTLLAALEQEGKEHMRQHRPLAARDAYRHLIEEDPSNLEARFDLAQVYSSIDDHHRAIHRYKEILDQSPLHRAALTVYEASKRYQDPSIQSSLLYRIEKGRDELKNMKLCRPALRITRPSAGSCVFTTWSEVAYSHYVASRRSEDVLHWGGGLDWQPSLRSKFSGFLYLNHYSGNLNTTLSGDCAIHYDLGDCTTIGIGVSQEDILSNHYNFDRHVFTRSAYVDVFTWLSQRNSLAARYAIEDYSDANRGQLVLVSLAHAFCEGPQVLSLKCDVFGKDVNDTFSHQYWTPNWYWEWIVSAEWEHHPSKEYFAEYDPFWYRIKAGGGTDRDGQWISKGRAEAYRDYGNAWQLQSHIEGSYSDAYSILEVGAAVVCFF